MMCFVLKYSVSVVVVVIYVLKSYDSVIDTVCSYSVFVDSVV